MVNENNIGGVFIMEGKRRIILRRKEISVHCPFCGRYMFTLGYGVSGKVCERCNNHLIAIFDECGFRLLEERRCAEA